LSSSRLTLPSSGPAYGGPLKSNVRPRFKLHHESTSAVRFATCALARKKKFAAGASPPSRCAKSRPVPLSSSGGLPGVRGECKVAPAREREMQSTYLGTGPVWAQSQDSSRSRSVVRMQCQSHIFAYPKSAGQSQAPAAMQLVQPALVCFAIQMKTQIHGRAVAQRAMPNPSFKRTRLRRSA